MDRIEHVQLGVLDRTQERPRQPVVWYGHRFGNGNSHLRLGYDLVHRQPFGYSRTSRITLSAIRILMPLRKWWSELNVAASLLLDNRAYSLLYVLSPLANVVHPLFYPPRYQRFLRQVLAHDRIYSI